VGQRGRRKTADTRKKEQHVSYIWKLEPQYHLWVGQSAHKYVFLPSSPVTYLCYYSLVVIYGRVLETQIINKFLKGEENLSLQAQRDEDTEWPGESLWACEWDKRKCVNTHGCEGVNVWVRVWVNVWYSESVLDCESQQASELQWFWLISVADIKLGYDQGVILASAAIGLLINFTRCY
jgi:hypothetical protein